MKLDGEQLESLLARIDDRFYIPLDAARDAVAGFGSFNLVETGTGYKVDLFVVGGGLLDQRQIERRVRTEFGGAGQTIAVTAADDQLLRKLEWFRAGGEVSDRQWRDIVGLVSISSQRMNLDEVRAVADQLGLRDLLDEAIRQADHPVPGSRHPLNRSNQT